MSAISPRGDIAGAGSAARTGLARIGVVLILACAALGTWSGAALAQCAEDPPPDELEALRRERGVQERLIRKAGRHEFSLLGGLYAADLLSSTYLLQAAYTYHLVEDLGVEASFGYSRARSELSEIVTEDTSLASLGLDTPIYVYEGLLLWSIAYGKLRWFSGDISRFDVNVALGGGVTDSDTAEGLTLSGGLGIKFLLREWFAVRVDVRDHVLTQGLLGVSGVEHNLAATLGVSLLVPLSS